ncbi:hypothetical protein [uncultured Desulfuromonas sp.]|uniref:hypothetical protein n=1 Tax=uncultured Desulfuromonas sp. TaxID=181013 RepID=UPI002AABB3A1|nr:hypothetical protein [uncultured Desulfuromonas sp.]
MSYIQIGPKNLFHFYTEMGRESKIGDLPERAIETTAKKHAADLQRSPLAMPLENGPRAEHLRPVMYQEMVSNLLIRFSKMLKQPYPGALQRRKPKMRFPSCLQN